MIHMCTLCNQPDFGFLGVTLLQKKPRSHDTGHWTNIGTHFVTGGVLVLLGMVFRVPAVVAELSGGGLGSRLCLWKHTLKPFSSL